MPDDLKPSPVPGTFFLGLQEKVPGTRRLSTFLGL